jgi:hypothetical protein
MQVVAGLNIDELTRAVAAKVHLEPLGETVPDIDEISGAVESKLNIGPFMEEVRSVSNRLDLVEKEFSTESGSVAQLQVAMDAMKAQQSTTSVERAGYVFKGPEDVEAFIMLAGPKAKLSTKCLDIISLLTLSQDPFVTYEAGIQVHSNAIKANFDTVVESRVKISFEIPYPEMIIKTVENATTAARGGAKWAPLFTLAEGFEDDFRDGAHRRVMRGIDNAYELTQKSIDSDYPIGYSGPKTTDVRKVHAILSDQLRRAYRQTVTFVDCLLPFYRTLKGGSLSKEEAWDRVFIFVLEVLTSVQEERVMSLDIGSESSMIWGAFKATDFTEDFRNKKFVKHHTALAILALTSIE